MPVTFPITQPADNAAPYTYTQPIRDAIATANDHETRLTSAELRIDALDGISNIGNVGATLAVTPGGGNGCVKRITLTSATCTITFNTFTATGKARSMEFEITQDATGGRTIVWPSSVKWPGGVAPTLSTAANSVDIISFVTYTDGTTYRGNLVGKGYA